MKSLCLLVCVCQWMQLSAMFIRTPFEQTTPAPVLDNDMTNGSMLIKVEKPEILPEIEFPKKHNGSFVGFTAWKQSDQAFSNGETIIFEASTVNEGGYYQPSLSRFTCPFQGVYYVAVTFRSTGITDYTATEVVDELFVFSYTFNEYIPNNIVSNSGIIRCQQGEQLYVVGVGSGMIYGEVGLPHSTFTIFMMYEGGAKENQHESFIGFNAYKADAQSYTAGDTITFQGIWFNEGNYYSPSLSRFLCPVTGTYFVVVHLMKDDTGPLHIAVDKGSVPILNSDDDNEENYHNTLSNSGLIRCNEGQIISVKGTAVGQIWDRELVTFSVMMMHEEGMANEHHQSFIGFSAWKKSRQLYTEGETITFEGILLNEGEKYQPIPSRFSCDISGIYFVALTCKKDSTYDMQVDVQVGFTTVLRLTDLEAGNTGNTVSNSVLVRCFAGEAISVVGVESGIVHGDTNKPLSVFTAMLMYPY